MPPYLQLLDLCPGNTKFGIWIGVHQAFSKNYLVLIS